LRWLRFGLGVALLLCATGICRRAQAYPQFQFSSGTSRCSECHFAPAGGGGLLTSYGRDASEELSSFKGNGGFLHGAATLPSWLALGFDGRGAYASNSTGGTTQTDSAIFPMQADAYGRAAFLHDWSLTVTAGYRGERRSATDDTGANAYEPEGASQFISREHYLMWRPASLGPYVRAGRFFAPYGLQLAEHTTYIRRDLGFNLLEETYNLSGGIIEQEWELHLTAFA
jgi:hypothetical protein